MIISGFLLTLFTFIQGISVWIGSWLIISAERISFREKSGVFGFEIVEIPVNRVTAISATKQNFFHYLFNYGHVKLNVAGQETPYKIRDLSNPVKIKKILEKKLFNQQE